MRNSKEIRKIFEAKGCLVEVVSFGTSYRAGGAILIFAPHSEGQKKWKIEKRAEKALDGTGYDGRGRKYDIYIFQPDENGWEAISLGEYSALPEDSRIEIGFDSRSGENALLFGDKSKDNFGDLKGIFEVMGL